MSELYSEAEAITRDRKARLETLKSVISENMNAFVKAGEALLEIIERELYREEINERTGESYTDWELYLRDVFPELAKSRRQSYYLMQAAQTIRRIEAENQKVNNCANPTELNCTIETEVLPLPINEGSIRPITQMPPHQQVPAYKKAVEVAKEQGRSHVNYRDSLRAVQTFQDKEPGTLAHAPDYKPSRGLEYIDGPNSKGPDIDFDVVRLLVVRPAIPGKTPQRKFEVTVRMEQLEKWGLEEILRKRRLKKSNEDPFD